MALHVTHFSIPLAHQVWRLTRVESEQTHSVIRVRGKGPGLVPRHPGSQLAPPQSPPSWTWSCSYIAACLGRLLVFSHSPGAQQAAPGSKVSFDYAGRHANGTGQRLSGVDLSKISLPMTPGLQFLKDLLHPSTRLVALIPATTHISFPQSSDHAPHQTV